MGGQYIYYIESNAICFIIFAILFVHDLISGDRQEKQLKYDNALVGFMLYFLSDSVWAMVMDGIIPITRVSVMLSTSANFILMAVMTFLWLRYVLAVEEVKFREKPLSRILMILPFVISMIACAIIYAVNPMLLIDSKFLATDLFSILMTIVPIIYIITVLVFAIRRAVKEENPQDRKRHYYIGFFPLVVVLGGILQLVFPNAPILCFGCTILMIIYYIHSMDAQISTDALTQLNNRGQLMRYTSQPSKLFIEGRKTYVVMMDVNDFKGINDNFGHASGDTALVTIADAIKNVIQDQEMPIFACRFGGDEFILIVNPYREDEVIMLIEEIRTRIDYECTARETPFRISIGAGYDELLQDNDTVQKCMQRADEKLYKDKEAMKKAILEERR